MNTMSWSPLCISNDILFDWRDMVLIQGNAPNLNREYLERTP